MQNDGRRQGDLAGEFAHDLRGRDDGALLDCERGERLRELSVAVVLTDVRCGEKLLGGRQFGGQLSAVASVGSGSSGTGASVDPNEINSQLQTTLEPIEKRLP